MKEKKKRYAFQLYLTPAESELFEHYASSSGMKKYAIVHKALREYLDKNEQNAEN